jgi:hypothetical protein
LFRLLSKNCERAAGWSFIARAGPAERGR